MLHNRVPQRSSRCKGHGEARHPQRTAKKPQKALIYMHTESKETSYVQRTSPNSAGVKHVLQSKFNRQACNEQWTCTSAETHTAGASSSQRFALTHKPQGNLSPLPACHARNHWPAPAFAAQCSCASTTPGLLSSEPGMQRRVRAFRARLPRPPSAVQVELRRVVRVREGRAAAQALVPVQPLACRARGPRVAGPAACSSRTRVQSSEGTITARFLSFGKQARSVTSWSRPSHLRYVASGRLWRRATNAFRDRATPQTTSWPPRGHAEAHAVMAGPGAERLRVVLAMSMLARRLAVLGQPQGNASPAQ